MKHVNIPLFVPHLGCPCQCTFCNQHTITGQQSEMTPEKAVEQIEAICASLPLDCDAEIAFFGGSFTAIPKNHMIALLTAAQTYIASGPISSIRISTRPDAINDEILDLLTAYHVKTIELGIQSMSDRVLHACKRGHTAADTEHACRLITARGFILGGQMMVGLPSSTADDEVYTASAIASMGAQEARIYPTAVFHNTELYRQMKAGEYSPLTLSEAVSRGADALDVFERANVKVLRIGLCESDGLHAADGLAGGVYHPAIGELCRSELYRRRFIEALNKRPDLWKKRLTAVVATGKLSAAIGQHQANRTALIERFSLPSLRFTENQRLSGYNFEITVESEQLCD